MTANTSWATENSGCRKLAMKQNKPHQCCIAAWLTLGRLSKAKELPMNLKPFPRSCISQAAIPSSSPPSIMLQKLSTTDFPLFSGSLSFLHCLQNRFINRDFVQLNVSLCFSSLYTPRNMFPSCFIFVTTSSPSMHTTATSSGAERAVFPNLHASA